MMVERVLVAMVGINPPWPSGQLAPLWQPVRARSWKNRKDCAPAWCSAAGDMNEVRLCGAIEVHPQLQTCRLRHPARVPRRIQDYVHLCCGNLRESRQLALCISL